MLPIGCADNIRLINVYIVPSICFDRIGEMFNVKKLLKNICNAFKSKDQFNTFGVA